MDLYIINSPCTARVGPQGARTATYDARVRFLQILVVSISLRVRKGTVRHHCGSGPARPRTSALGYEKHWKFPCGACTGPVVGCDWGIKRSQRSVRLTFTIVCKVWTKGMQHSQTKHNAQVCFLCIFQALKTEKKVIVDVRYKTLEKHL